MNSSKFNHNAVDKGLANIALSPFGYWPKSMRQTRWRRLLKRIITRR